MSWTCPGHGDIARQPFASPLSVVDAGRILERTEIFEFGTMPPKRQVQALNLLLDQPNASTRLAALAARAALAGRLYAACGFLLLESPEAAALLRELSAIEDRVLVVEHDVVLGELPAARVVALIEEQRVCEGMRRIKDETAAYFNRVG